MELYNLRSTETPNAYIITKFNEDFEVQTSYLLTHDECACPRGEHRKCRHREMLPYFKKLKHIDDGWFLDWHTRQWHEPLVTIAPDDEAEADREAEESTAPITPPAPPGASLKRRGF